MPTMRAAPEWVLVLPLLAAVVVAPLSNPLYTTDPSEAVDAAALALVVDDVIVMVLALTRVGD